MARATNGLGQFRGKVGSVVFRVSQGQQIASAYQPAVKNPKSNLQTAQRNKLYLASQLSKLVPREDIVGLDPQGTARDRRSILIRNIINSSTSTLSGETFQTTLDGSRLFLSQGRSITQDVIAEINTNTDPGESSVITIGSRLDRETYNRLAIKLVQFSVVNGEYSAYKSSWLPLSAFNENQEFTTTLINFTTLEGSMLYLIPVLLKDNVRYSTEKKTLVQITDEGDFVIQGEYALNNAVYQWCTSIYAGLSGGGEVKPPYIDGDEVVNPDGPNFPNLG